MFQKDPPARNDHLAPAQEEPLQDRAGPTTAHLSLLHLQPQGAEEVLPRVREYQRGGEILTGTSLIQLVHLMK